MGVHASHGRLRLGAVPPDAVLEVIGLHQMHEQQIRARLPDHRRDHLGQERVPQHDVLEHLGLRRHAQALEDPGRAVGAQSLEGLLLGVVVSLGHEQVDARAGGDGPRDRRRRQPRGARPLPDRRGSEVGHFLVPAPARARGRRDRIREHAVARRPHARDDRRVIGIGDRGKDALRRPRVAPGLEQCAKLRRRPGIVEIELWTQAVDRDDDDMARARGPRCVDRAADQRAQHGHRGEQTPTLHGIPPQWARLAFPLANAIGMTVWETDTVPSQWYSVLNHVVDVWLPCAFNVDTFSSGLGRSPFRLPHPVISRHVNGERAEIDTLTGGRDDFVFYSIFEWQERGGHTVEFRRCGT